MLSATVYANRDNTIELALTENGTAIADHTAITRVRLEFAGQSIDSSTEPGLFTLGGTDRIVLKLGAAGIDHGRHRARLIVYSADWPNGLVWMTIELTFLE